jgi:flagellin
MSLGVLNNINASYAENNLNKTSSSLSKVLNELSSGSKINSGSDDAAGLSLVNGLAANSAALTQSSTNATEGVGLLQVADGALSQVTSLLNRAVTLATEASNGTLNSTQDAAANEEYQSILSEISNIGTTTTYNGKAVFGSTTDIYTGDSSTAGASVDTLSISSLNATKTGGTVGDAGGTMNYSAGTSAGVTETYTFGTGAAETDKPTALPTAISYTPSSGGAAQSYTLTGLTTGTSSISDVITSINKGTSTTGVTASWNSTTESLVLTGSGDSATSLTGTITDASGATTSPTGTAGTVAASTATISYTASAGIDLSSTKLDNATDAKSALTALNTAISDVAAQDGYVGAQINTLNSVSSVLSTQQENVLSAQNAVQATDYATATSDMSKYEILSQTGISALAQANSVQQEVTKLLQ